MRMTPCHPWLNGKSEGEEWKIESMNVFEGLVVRDGKMF